MTEVSKGKLQVLEEIFDEKYEDFMYSYWMILEYSEKIKNIDYVNTPNKLKLRIKLKDTNAKKLAKKLTKEHQGRVDVNCNDDMLTLVFKKE